VKKVVSFSLDEGTIRKLDSEAKAFGMSRSELLEFMLQRGWHFSKDMEETASRISELQEKAKKKHLGDQDEE